MINIKLFNSLAAIYLFASVLYLCYFFFKKQTFRKAAFVITCIGLFIQTLGYIFRWVESYKLGFGHTPFSFFTLYETIMFASWCMTVAYLLVEYIYRMQVLGAFILPIISLMILYATLSLNMTADARELPEVLRGNFFAYHVVSVIMSYAAFGMSFVASVIILMMEYSKKKILRFKKLLEQFPSLKTMDDLSYKTIAIGFILSTIGMATGVYRTKVLWQSYWNWDPVETTGLITWLFYLLILHGRYQRWWNINMSAVLSIIAFIVKIVCFLIAGSYVMKSGHYPII